MPEILGGPLGGASEERRATFGGVCLPEETFGGVLEEVVSWHRGYSLDFRRNFGGVSVEALGCVGGPVVGLSVELATGRRYLEEFRTTSEELRRRSLHGRDVRKTTGGPPEAFQYRRRLFHGGGIRRAVEGLPEDFRRTPGGLSEDLRRSSGRD